MGTDLGVAFSLWWWMRVSLAINSKDSIGTIADWEFLREVLRVLFAVDTGGGSVASFANWAVLGGSGSAVNTSTIICSIASWKF
jgi:hypothetical protein